ncbi:MAG TPA: hypothetical protein VL088_09335 [Pedobacter sp.]|nr:hypothetical protein [Pedobacter sp.]
MDSVDCIIYCTGNMLINVLRNKLGTLIGSDKIEVSFIEKDFYELSIYNNDDFNSDRQKDFPDGFLYFKFIVEVGFNNNCEVDNAVPVVSKILNGLWDMGMPSVASCDYENLLPENGGYNSPVIPWPSVSSSM